MAGNVLFGAKIIGTGKADLGEDSVVTNEKLAKDLAARIPEACKFLGVEKLPADLEEKHKTDHDWIWTRVGVNQRHIVGDKVATSNLAISAGLNALKDAGIGPEEIGCLRLATVTPDNWASPPTVSKVMAGLGIPVWDSEGFHLHEISATDQSYACSTFLGALRDAYVYLAAGVCRYALVIGADKMSSITNWHDRGFCSILADHGAALLMEGVPFEQSDFKREWFYAGGDGSKGDRIITPVGGSRQPLTSEIVKNDPLFNSMKLTMQGSRVFKELVSLLKGHIIPEALEKAGLAPIDINVAIFHQANLRMIEPVEAYLRELGLPEKSIVYNTIQRYGNTTCASIPVGIHDARVEGVLQRGQTVMLVVMGGGYSWLVAFLRWSL